MEEIDLKEVLNYFKSKIIWIILAIILAIGIGNGYEALTRKPLYSSDTSIILVSNNTNQSSANLSELQVNKNSTKIKITYFIFKLFFLFYV